MSAPTSKQVARHWYRCWRRNSPVNCRPWAFCGGFTDWDQQSHARNSKHPSTDCETRERNLVSQGKDHLGSPPPPGNTCFHIRSLYPGSVDSCASRRIASMFWMASSCTGSLHLVPDLYQCRQLGSIQADSFMAHQVSKRPDRHHYWSAQLYWTCVRNYEPIILSSLALAELHPDFSSSIPCKRRSSPMYRHLSHLADSMRVYSWRIWNHRWRSGRGRRTQFGNCVQWFSLPTVLYH